MAFAFGLSSTLGPIGQRQGCVVKERKKKATKVARFLGKLRNDKEKSV
jgi:hypothetical protein